MNDAPSRFASFIAELRHRRVFRVAAVYACVAFIIFQIVDATFEPLHLPEWSSTLVVVLLALGFPIAVGMAWAFDITEKGIVRTKGKAQASATSRRPILNIWILGIVAALAVILAAWSWWGQPVSAGTINSIAVLPLDNLSGDPEQVYFVEGMHEALISELSNIGAVTVISRRSTLQYKDSEKTMPTIASELGVDALLEGSAQLVGERVRITTQLIDSQDRHLWSNTYERNLEDVFALYNDVTRAIAQEIQAKLTPEEEIRLASVPQVNPEAYNLYLKGWHLHNQESSRAEPRAMEYLEQAVALDSTFARAWAALAHSYFMMPALTDWTHDPRPLMKSALDKALELDPTLPDAHTCLGIYQFWLSFDIAGAEASFKWALELNPDNTWNLYEYGHFLQAIGRPDEALAESWRAHELDPLYQQPLEGIARVYSWIRQYEKALEYRRAILEIAPGHKWGRSNLTGGEKREILMQQGRYAEAAAEAENAGDLFHQLRAEIALGNRDKVYSVRDSLRSTGELQQREQEDPFGSARFYAIIGERKMALGLLERAYKDKILTSPNFRMLVYFPEFDSLRGEPRFKALLKKIGLTEVFDQYGQRIR